LHPFQDLGFTFRPVDDAIFFDDADLPGSFRAQIDQSEYFAVDAINLVA